MLIKLFPNPIIPSLAMAFEPLICTCFLDLVGCQKITGVMSFLGFVVLIPGKMLILIGQWAFKKQTIKDEREERNRLTQLTERYTRISSKMGSKASSFKDSGSSPLKKEKS